MVNLRGIELAHDVSGVGPDVIWGHGMTSSRAAEDELPPIDWSIIRTQNRVVRYDTRGHGDSGSTDVPGDYSWHSLALDQLALADHLGIETYVGGGASMGCGTALHATVMAPDRIRGLLLVIPPTAWETRAVQSRGYGVIADLVAAGDHRALLAGAAAAPSPDPFSDDPRWKARFPRLLEATDPVRLERVFRGAATADLPAPEDIARIAVPTLILAWTGDPGHPVSTAEQLSELIPGSDLALSSTADEFAGWTGRALEFLAQF